MPCIFSAYFSHSSRLARKRFISRERSDWHFISIPEGSCFRYTQLAVLLIFCPPLPEPRMNFSTRSSGRIPRASILASRAFHFDELAGMGGG